MHAPLAYTPRLKGNESRDCVVRALASATGMPYEEAHTLAAQKGRRFGKGTQWHVVYKLFDAVGERHAADHSMTVGRFIAMHPTGTYILSIKGHVFTLKDGVVHDMGVPSERAHLYLNWWHVTKKHVPKEAPAWVDKSTAMPAHLQAILRGKVRAVEPSAVLEG